MSFDFPLILFVATAFTGLVWILELFWLRPRRQSTVEILQQAPGKSGQSTAVPLKEPLIVEYSVSFFPVLAIVFILRSFLAEPFQIPTGSMIPTLQIGDFIVVNKFAYGIRLPVIGTKIADVGDPQNGDVMVFIPPHRDEYFIKRVVGIPGDRVRYEDKQLYINGELQTQRFIAQLPPQRPRYQVYEETLGSAKHLIHRNVLGAGSITEWEVPAGYYFMMGDNRDRSSDSRFWGLVSEDDIVGKAFAIWLHKNPGFHLPEFSRNGWIQ